jgi:hypothetical protein
MKCLRKSKNCCKPALPSLVPSPKFSRARKYKSLKRAKRLRATDFFSNNRGIEGRHDMLYTLLSVPVPVAVPLARMRITYALLTYKSHQDPLQRRPALAVAAAAVAEAADTPDMLGTHPEAAQEPAAAVAAARCARA